MQSLTPSVNLRILGSVSVSTLHNLHRRNHGIEHKQTRVPRLNRREKQRAAFLLPQQDNLRKQIFFLKELHMLSSELIPLVSTHVHTGYACADLTHCLCLRSKFEVSVKEKKQNKREKGEKLRNVPMADRRTQAAMTGSRAMTCRKVSETPIATTTTTTTRTATTPICSSGRSILPRGSQRK